jgi:hypothetical protein
LLQPKFLCLSSRVISFCFHFRNKASLSEYFYLLHNKSMKIFIIFNFEHFFFTISPPDKVVRNSKMYSVYNVIWQCW